jgi:hypothetical protein
MPAVVWMGGATAVVLVGALIVIAIVTRRRS